jgi:hypothetical protein
VFLLFLLFLLRLPLLKQEATMPTTVHLVEAAQDVPPP